MNLGRAWVWALSWLVLGAQADMAAHAASAVRLIGQGLLERSGPGLDQFCRVEISPADGVTSIDLVVHYDPSVVEPTGVYRTAMTHGFTLAAYLDTPGTVELQLDGTTPLSGTGDVAWIGFRIVGTTGNSAALAWGSATLNGGDIASTTQVVRNITVGSSDVTVFVPKNLQVQAASTVVVDISATAFPGTPDFEFSLRYNPLVAQVTNVQKTTLSNPLNLVWNGPNPPGGLLQVALYGTNPVSGSGAIVRVTFQVTGAAGSRMPLNLERARIQEVVKFTDDGYLSVCPASCNDGNVCTLDACVLGECAHEPLPGVVCRPSTGPCDPEETCPGDAAACPADAFEPFVDPPTTAPILEMFKEAEGAVLSWPSLAEATSFDAVRGDLATLATTSGDYSLATDVCLDADFTATALGDADDPRPGAGFWYLVRASNCVGDGSYDGPGAGQVAPRDAGIAASAAACP